MKPGNTKIFYIVMPRGTVDVVLCNTRNQAKGFARLHYGPDAKVTTRASALRIGLNLCP